MTWTTVSDAFSQDAAALKALAAEFFIEHSTIYRPPPREGFYPGQVLINTSGDYEFRELSEQGRQLQSRLWNDYHHFAERMRLLLAKITPDGQKEFESNNRPIRRLIEHAATPHRNTQEALAEFTQAIEQQVGLLSRLYDPLMGHPIFVPDTNALLHNTDLTSWAFEDVDKFRLILLPVVLGELDKLKIEYRNERVREKAKTLIRMIKGFRGRGRLTDGVTVVKHKIDLLAIATEAPDDAFMPWFDRTNADDRYLASVIELMRRYPRSPVVIVTRDINLQNKAEYSRLPAIEPPDPVAAAVK